ncbi:hypothetical protein [Deinococcus multiflagellatus]|uniref:Uncharacterized protein n=1 Tax=Deinococcus multiflagellatus TaxID=1656887 RepID=A0ABW1ZR83_9DEIO|nr:hypothetical protein [Deinococcus multiflagellatus]MBZ9715917.1 hypothetical protein [Deinococcus multiflagellatus]
MNARDKALQDVIRRSNPRPQPGTPGRDRPLRRRIGQAYLQTHRLLGDLSWALQQGGTPSAADRQQLADNVAAAQALLAQTRPLPLTRGGVRARQVALDNANVAQEALDVARRQPLRGTLPDLLAELRALGVTEVDLRGLEALPLAGAWEATPAGWDWRLLELSVPCPEEGCRVFVGHARLP